MEKVCRLERVENKIKVHNFTTRHIKKGLLQLLQKGPNTIPKTTIPIYERQEKCKNYLRDVLKQIVYCKSSQPKLTPLGLELNRPSISKVTRDLTLDNCDFIHDFIDNIPNTDAATDNDQVMKDLYQLSKETEFIVNVADKNLGFVINNTSWYINELDRQLSDKTTYREITDITKEELIDISKTKLNKLTTDLKDVYIMKREHIKIYSGKATSVCNDRCRSN